MSDSGDLRRGISLRSATALVIANVIGAGIFTTTGYQASALGDPAGIFALWIVGGLLAWCGALCYGELGAAMPEAGAEYVYLRQTYGRAFGFTSAFVSFVAGFPAPIAAALKGLVAYLGAFVPAFAENPAVLGSVALNDLVAVGLVWALTLIHLRGVEGGIRFNDGVTLLKVVGIVAIIVGAFAVGDGELSNFSERSVARPEGAALLGAYATSLIFVMFCYSGWNAAAYVASEIEAPQRNLPRALLVGTGIVLVLYLGLNAVYFYGAGVGELAGKPDVGLVAARNLFGPIGVGLVTCVLGVSLLASASAMTIAGPRVTFAMARDVPFFGRPGANRLEDGRSAPRPARPGCRHLHTGAVGAHRPDPAVRRLHPRALLVPGRVLRVGPALETSGSSPPVPHLRLPDHSALLSGGNGVDDVLGLHGATRRVIPGPHHGGGRRRDLRLRLANG